MSKRMRELQALILQKSKEANSYLEGETKDIDKAAAALDEVDRLQKEFETLERAEKAAKAGVPTADVQAPEAEKRTSGAKAFADAVRSRFKDLSEGVPGDGGYTVPEDISTKVLEYKQEHFSLASLIDHETVTTLSGRRTYKTRAQHTGFAEVGEGAKIGKTGAPTFEILEYKIKKYAGYMPVTDELLADSDEAIMEMMTRWLAEDGVATENAQILAKIQAKEATPLTGIKDIKKAVNVTLAAFAGSVRIITNADGLQYLDTLEDGNKRPLLSPDPAQPMEMMLSIGTRRIPLTVLPNHIMPSAEGGAIPFVIGDLHEYLTQFDRKQLTLTVSNTAVAGDFNAFEQDMTLIKATMRADWQVKDEAAIVYGQLTA